MKRKLNYFAFVFAILLGLFGFVGIAQSASAKIYAAEFSYQEGRDGFELTADDDLKVTFTVSEMESGLTDGLIKWAVYLIDPATGLAYNETTHKYEDDNNRQRYVADYYFLLDPSNAYDSNDNKVTANSAGTYTMYVDANDVAYHAASEPQSATDFGTNTGKVMSQVLNQKNWIIGVGPMFENWWTSGYGAPIDYYVGRQAELVKETIYFKDFDGTVISSKKYTDASVAIDVSGVNYTKDTSKTWTGWYCDATKQTYNDLDDIQSLMVSDVMSNTKIVNFYATYQRGNGKYIEFTPVANYTGNYTQDTENDTILIEESNNTTTFSVTYKITHNDGVNSILLLPEFDTSKFSIKSVNIDETTSLGEATITYDGYDKILLESEHFYNGLNDTFLTITFNIDKAVDGDYEFGLKLAPVVHNDVSEAYYYLSENNLGEQEEVEIRLVRTNNVVRILTLKDAEILIGKNAQDDQISGDSYLFGYAKRAVSVTKVDGDVDENTENLVVKYSYNGTAEPVIKWYTEAGEELENAPAGAGRYYVGISAPAHGMYHAVSEVYRLVVINPVAIEITIDNKTSAYSADIVALTYQITSGAVLEGDTLSVTLSTTATKTSPVGTYPITGSYDLMPNYSINIVDGVYTITPKAITITALDQTAEYTGSEPTVDQSKYTVEGIEAVSGVTITKESGVNVGDYILTPSLNNTNYDITFVNGTFHITSVGKDAEYIKSFFSGDTVTYDANSHDLLIVAANIPSWISANYTASNNIQTNANTYTISVVVTLDDQTAANYTSGVKSFNSTVEGKINPYALTITADNNGHVYGNEPAELTPKTVNGCGEDVINVTFTVKNNGEAIVLSTTTPVGGYDIVPFAENSNYAFEFVNGTYTVSKAQAVVTVSAENVLYNRDLVLTHGATVGTLTIDNYTVVVKNASNEVVDPSTVLDAGEYTIVVTVEGTANYTGAQETATFTVSPIALETPTVSYNKETASWTAVTKDAGAENVENSAKALVDGTTVTYTVNSTAVNGLSYTATSKGALTLVVSSSNPNYLPVEITLEEVFEVEFDGGSHPANPADPTNMPDSQYIFKGQTATSPSENPTLAGYTFKAWDFDFATVISEDKVIVALWDVNSYTITFKYTDDAETQDTDLFAFEINYNETITYETLNLTPVKSSNDAGIYYTFNGEWISNLLTYVVNENGKLANEGTEYVVVGDATFVAQYNTNYNQFKVNYFVKENGGAYAPHGEPTLVTYLEEIVYNSLSTNIHWFTAKGWFANEEATQVAPTIMPNHDIDVYGQIVFDIGQGDVNADGLVNANDITLYRQWIVGGYGETVVENGTEWTTAQNFDQNARYFLYRVADNNADSSKDIRDVSITRMVIVGGYTWDNDEGVNVTGQEIIRNVRARTLNEIDTAVKAGKKVTVVADITEDEGVLNIETSKNIYIDLNGHTLNIDLFNVVSTLRTTITVKNGTIVTTEGITISAPNGNVILQNLTGYVGDSEVTLQAANHSLHIKENVAFYKNQNDATLEPVAVKIADNTHIVVEENADLVVEKLVVENQGEISITVNSETTSIITVEGQCEVENNVSETKVYTEDDELLALVKAAKEGGEFTLDQDYVISESLNVESDLTLNLNGHKIYNTTDIWAGDNWSLISVRSGTLTINGEGSLEAKANDCYALDVRNGASLVVNDGTYVGNISAIYVHTGTATVNGGDFSVIQSMTNPATGHERFTLNLLDANGKNGTASIVVKGGTFEKFDPSNNVAEGANTNFVADGYGVAQIGNKYQVLQGVAQIGNNICNSLEDAISASNSNDTIKLLSDIDFSTTYTERNARDYGRGYAVDLKDLTLDLNGHTIKSINATVTFGGNGATIKNGTFDLVEKNTDGSYKDGSYALIIDNNVLSYGETGTVNLKDVVCDGGLNVCSATVTLDNVSTHTTTTKFYAVWAETNATLTINSGNFVDAQTTGKGVIATGTGTEGGAKVYINGGEFEGVNKLVYNAEANSIEINGGSFDKDPSAYVAKAHYVVEENGVYTVNEYTKVSSQEELISEVANGGYIQFDANIALDQQIVVDKDVTLDLNGKTVSYASETLLTSGLFGVKRGATLTINDTVGTGEIDASSKKVYAAVALTIKGEDVTGNKAKVVVNSGTLKGYYYGVVGNGNRHNTEVVVNNGTLYGVNGTGIYNPQDGKVTINDGSIKGLDVAVEMRAGELVVNNGVFEALTQEFSVTSNGSGTTVSGAILAISQHSTLKNITVTINGGIFTNGIRALVMYDTINSTHSDLMNVTINNGTFNSVVNAKTKTIDVNNGNLVINGGEFDSAADNEGYGCSTVYAANYGYVTINGGTFKASAKYNNRYWTINVQNASKNTAKMIVCGGTYYEFDPSNPNTDDSVTYVEKGHTVSSSNVGGKIVYIVA